MCYFDTIIEDEHNRYLSEDYMFCQWSRKIGLKIWMCPWMQLSHQGAYNFSGNIPAISQVPNATHGGMVDTPAKTQAAPGAAMIAPPVVDPEGLRNRAEKRRAAAIARREKKKAEKAAKQKD
jgi:hypothetical protein